MKKRIRSSATSTLMFVFLSALLVTLFIRASEGKRRKSISDNLADVMDEEEDEQWKEWGKTTKKKSSTLDFDPPPDYDFSKLSPEEIQNDMMKRHVGPTFGFVKLRVATAASVSRSPEDVSEIATRWSKLLRTASMEVTFMVVDLNTVMFTMEKGQNTLELKDFILNQEDAYEVKIGDNLFRRHGDPPLDEVVQMMRKTTAAVDEL